MKQLPLDPHAAGLALHFALRDPRLDRLRDDDALDALDLYLTDATLIRHFKAREVVRLTTQGGVRNKVPTPLLWPNIVPTLLVLEWLRAQFGNAPIAINSGYRSAAYNAAVGGAPESLHRRFNALDIRVAGAKPKDVAAMLETHTEAGLFGIGVYPGFTHVDVRGMLGLPKARW